MKKFRLTINIAGATVYRAVVSLNEEQYQRILDQYSRHRASVNYHIIEEITGSHFDENRDYVKESPDAVVSALICDQVDLFDSRWCDFNPFDQKDATLDIEVNETESFEWTCEPVNEVAPNLTQNVSNAEKSIYDMSVDELEVSSFRLTNVFNELSIETIADLMKRCMEGKKFIGLKVSGIGVASNYEIAVKLHELGLIDTLDGIRVPRS